MKIEKILLSFVGSNDAGEMRAQSDGAILTALKNEKYSKVLLLWNEAKINEIKYSQVVKYLKEEIGKRKLAKKVDDVQLNISDVTDHNTIYNLLKKFCDDLEKDKTKEYTAAISSGTPAMQVCWILLAESGDFSEELPLRLIKVKDPKYGTSKNINVKFGTSLPRILKLKNEIENVKKDLVPNATIDISRCTLTIGEISVDLSPIEFCYYRYFAERVINESGDEKFSGISVSLNFMKAIYRYHEESFFDLELNRDDLRKMIKKGDELSIQTFRGNISKANKKIRKSLEKETLVKNFQITIAGKRGAKFYGIKAGMNKLIITQQ